MKTIEEYDDIGNIDPENVGEVPPGYWEELIEELKNVPIIAEEPSSEIPSFV